jgi:transmembrane sensor
MADKRHEREEDERRNQAALWFTRIDGGSASGEDLDQFKAWLAADPLNEAAYREASDLWQALERPARRLAQKTPVPESIALKDTSHTAPPTAGSWSLRGGVKRAGFATGIAMAAALLVWIFVPTIFIDSFADHVSRRGETKQVVLPDGSSVEMASNTAIDLTFSKGQRGVRILHGEAYFSVKKRESAAPFIVHTGAAEIRVKGTKFNVDQIGQITEVTVQSGLVEVAGDSSMRSELLKGGERVTARFSSLSAVRPADIDTSLAWRNGRLIFRHIPLSRAIEKLGRYRTGRIIIANPNLADIKVSGTFLTSDPDTALDTLAASVAARLVYLSPWVAVIL